MRLRNLLLAVAVLVVTAGPLTAQYTPWYYWTLLDEPVMSEIVGEASGETAWNTVVAIGGFNRDRQAAEYEGTFYEAQYIFDQLRLYGLPGAEIMRYPGGSVWDGIKGELWEISPMHQKLASFTDLRAMLASGSNPADVTAEMVWVGRGSREEIEQAGVAGKIVVTEGSISGVHRLACQELGAEGVVCISNGRPFFDPLQIPWSGVGGRGASGAETKFGFFIPPREAESLKARLMAGERITVHAQVESTTREYDLEDPVCYIPGTDPDAGEVIFSAHLFEGYTKQGANDNKSGSAAILEVARTLHTLIDEGRIPRPRRTIRFLWGPEFSGTGPWVQAHQDLMEQTLCNINMDMVGEWLSKNQAFFCLMRTTYGNAHYINDVMENYYRFVGEGNRERIQNRSGFYKVPQRIVAPSGADEPFYYAIETHYGSSDHEVFNDWGVGVPGIMMIAWPDRWYHTSGDRADKADPTVLKRVAVIGAAGAYTVASADDDLAIRIASETASNGTARLGHQFMMGLEKLNQADAAGLTDAYRAARYLVEATVLAEQATLASVNELAEDTKKVGDHVAALQKMIEGVGQQHLTALEVHMNAAAARLGTAPARLRLTDLERRAGRIVPKPTERIRATGYRGYQQALNAVPESERARFPVGRGQIASTTELQLLCNGTFSALDIKKLLDAQFQNPSDLQAVLNHLELLKLAGLVDF